MGKVWVIWGTRKTARLFSQVSSTSMAILAGIVIGGGRLKKSTSPSRTLGTNVIARPLLPYSIDTQGRFHYTVFTKKEVLIILIDYKKRQEITLNRRCNELKVKTPFLM